MRSSLIFRLAAASALALFLGACDKCGGFNLGSSGWLSPAACSAPPRPQG